MAPEVRRGVPRAVAKSVNADAPSGVTKLMVSNLHYELTTKDLAVRPSSFHVSSPRLMPRAANLWAGWHTRPRAFDQGTKLAMHRVHLRETDPDLLSLVRLLSTTEAADRPASPSSVTRPPRRLPQRRGSLMGSSPRVWILLSWHSAGSPAWFKQLMTPLSRPANVNHIPPACNHGCADDSTGRTHLAHATDREGTSA